MAPQAPDILQKTDGEWVTFPGGELEGRRPKRLCPSCLDRQRLAGPDEPRKDSRRGTLCFQCYRLDLDRDKALKAASELNTASDARFQCTLPWEPVDHVRLAASKAVRATERAAAHTGLARFVDRRRRAQIAARRALQVVAEGLRTQASQDMRARMMADALHAAELQLPESWLPFVLER